ncbi:MAG: 1-deoxy-D-xylulose-5-phosphate synthase, partial [Chloroflexota bacterium]|nr:1-deoxy-D-xylulose-5-phosphate synthase [Chloroflexota bacterium]
LKAGFKGFLLPTMLWEELGFTYVGPIDGHDLAQLEDALRSARDYGRRPILLHVLTQKGKGYQPAEKDPVQFHGVAPAVERENGTLTYTKVFAQTALALFRQEPRLVAITAAMPEGTGLSLVAREFPQRVFNVDICEQHAVTMAAGLATQGFIPIVCIYSTFLQRAYDQVIHDVCLQNLPVIFAIDRAGVVGEDGKTHQGVFDLSYLGCVPNLVIAAPADENELRHLLYTAVRAGRPFALRYPRGAALGVPLDEEVQALPVGKGEIVREGHDLAIIALGSPVAASLEAASILAKEGIEATVVNARFAKPLDASLIVQVAQQTGRLATVEENTLEGGFGSAVLGLLERQGQRNFPVLRLGLPDRFIEHGPPALLRAQYGVDGPGIARQVKKAFRLSRLPPVLLR